MKAKEKGVGEQRQPANQENRASEDEDLDSNDVAAPPAAKKSRKDIITLLDDDDGEDHDKGENPVKYSKAPRRLTSRRPATPGSKDYLYYFQQAAIPRTGSKNPSWDCRACG